MTEYVAVVGLLLLVIAVVFVGARPVGVDIAEDILCVVKQVGEPAAPEDCVAEPGEPGGDDPSEPPGDGDEYGPPTGSCEEDVTFDKTNLEKQYASHVVQIDCVWYPVPTICASSAIPEGWFDRDEEDRVYPADEIKDFVDCVTGGYGPPKDDPEDESCVGTLPTSGEIDEDAPPKVQVGCKELPVPKGCEDEWAAYEDATEGKERAGDAGILANCVTKTLDRIEPACVVEATGHVDSNEMRFLFFRWGDSNGTLIEKLGDGRIRVHILKGVEQGAGVSGDDVGGSPVSFDIAGITGYSSDKTYEFTSTEKAQEWIDWYKEYDKYNGKPISCSGARVQWAGGCGKNPNLEKAEKLKDEEPEHHELAEAESDIRKVKLSGGLSLSTEIGPTELAGSIEGGYQGEIAIEDRKYSDGSATASYTSSDIGGFLIGASLGAKQPFTKDKDGKPKSSGSASGSGKKGTEWKGTTSTTVAWDKEGKLSKLIISMDDQVMQTLYKAGIDVSVALPYGFAVGGGYSKSEESGTISKRELIIDFNQYPELRETLGAKIDEVFPRDEDGNLKRDDVEISGENEEGGLLYDSAEDFANVRELTYDSTKVTEGGSAGLTWQGLDLFKASWTSVDEEQTLKESSFEVTDVDGNKQIIDPAPQCRHKKFEQPEDYYTDTFSDPPTKNLDSKHDFGEDYVDNESPKYTDGTYPGTDFDGDVPKDKGERVQSLVEEYGKAFPDKNVLVVKDFDNFSFKKTKGLQHVATVNGLDVFVLDEGVVENERDGGWINWGFTGEYSREEDDMNTVTFR